MSDPIDTDRTKRADIAATAIALGSELEKVRAERDAAHERLRQVRELCDGWLDGAPDASPVSKFANLVYQVCK